MHKRGLLISLLVFILAGALHGQELSAPPDSLNKRCLTVTLATATAGYAGSMAGLYSLWYKDYPMGGFHFLNDNAEWLMLDKCGHATTTYNIGRIGHNTLRNCGVSENKSILYGGLTGLFYLTTIEVLDGLSSEWGASPGDLAANTLGAALFVSQQLAWHEQKVLIKWSSRPSEFAMYNPGQLGKDLPQKLIKDYNGQTFWLSANISSLGMQYSGFPKWLNLAVGYGGDGLTGAKSNPEEINGLPVPPFERKKQFYISPDIDLTRVRVKSKWLGWMLNSIGFIKLPMPAVEVSAGKWKFHPLFF